MTKIITIAHQKGGVGKSTLAINLALCFQDQLSVALVDTDLQGSLYHIRKDFPDLAIIGADKFADIQKLAYDLIIIDTPPYLSNRLPELFTHSDFILVPTKAGFFDVMAIRSTIALISEAMTAQPGIRAGIVLNMVKPRSGITNDVRGLLESMELPLLKTIIHDRVSIARSSMTSGLLQSCDDLVKILAGALATPQTKKGFQKALREKGVQCILRQNEQGRIYGVTFIDLKNKVVFNGSDLDKAYSANLLSARLLPDPTPKPNMTHQQGDNDFNLNVQDELLDILFAAEREDLAALNKFKKKKRKGLNL